MREPISKALVQATLAAWAPLDPADAAPAPAAPGIRLGVHYGMPAAEYHSIAAASYSGLKLLAISPLHYFARYLDPARPAQEPSAAMRAGTLAHCALLEPDDVLKRYAIKPAGHDGRTKEGKAWNEASAGRDTITQEQFDAAQAQAAAVRALPEIGALLANGNAEVSAFWRDGLTGSLVKIRPDFVSPAGDGVVLVDLKTCQSASPLDFAKAVVNFDYALQACLYSEGWEQATGQRVLGFVFACTEKDHPHAAAAYMIDDRWLELARSKFKSLLYLYANCSESGVWPGYEQSIQLLPMPNWLAK